MPLEVYAFKNNEKVLRKSSSGGAFTEIISTIFRLYPKNEIIVYGAAFDENLNVKHMSANSVDECLKFNGSKYVQSNLKGVFESVITDLKQGKLVVFSGTPCQHKALTNLIHNKRIDDTNLIRIDIICHGTPKPKIWSDYVQWLEIKNKSKLIDFSFRYKGCKKSYSSYAKFENGKEKINSFDTKMYNRLFLRRLILTEKCFKCEFAKIERITDITLGDFWGIEKIMPDFPRNNGVSEILVNTAKGKHIIEDIKNFNKKNNDVVLEQCFSNEYIKYQNNLNRPAEKPIDYDDFKIEYKNKGIKFVMKKYAGYSLKGKIKDFIKGIWREK